MNKEQLIFGIYPVLEAVEAGLSLDKVFVQKDSHNPKIQQILDLLRGQQVTVNQVPVEKLDRMVRSNHQGIVAYTSPITFTPLEELVEHAMASDKAPLFVILDQISDVRNFGAIVRSAECTGVDGIIIQKKGGAPVSGDAVKTSAGALFKVPICKVDHIKDAIYFMQASGVKLVAATEKGQSTPYDLDLTQPLALVLGSEGKGINPSVLKLVDHLAALPMKGSINSLNVSVACGAMLYEVIRQRG